MPDTWLDGRLGPEAEVRPGFAADLEERLRAGWRGEPTVTPITPRHRRRWPLAVWGGAAAVLVAAVIVVVARRGDDGRPVGPATSTSVAPATSTTAVPTSSTAPSTSSPPSTATTTATTTAAPTAVGPAPTSVVATGTTLAVPLPSGGDVWGRSCTETVRATPQAVSGGDAAQASLGPLGAQPVATLTYPLDVGAANATWARIATVPGGVLIVAGTYGPRDVQGSVATLVDADGQVRWTRCWPGGSMLLVAAGESYALVQPADGSGMELVDLADGTRRGRLADLLTSAGTDLTGFDLGTNLEFRDDRDIVFSTHSTGSVDPATDRLLRVDLATMNGTVLPLPPAVAGMLALQLDRNDDGNLVLRDGNRPLAALVGNSWSTAPPDLSVWSGVRGSWAVDDGQPLRGLDGQGNVVWTSTDVFNSHAGEAQDAHAIGSMIVALACAEPMDMTSFECASGIQLVGVNSSDGSVAWRLPAAGVAAGDRIAIVSDQVTGGDGSGWVMLDTVTGEVVDGWSSDTAGEFSTECCAGGETSRTEIHGGIVVTLHDGRIHLWYPAGTPAPDTRIALP